MSGDACAGWLQVVGTVIGAIIGGVGAVYGGRVAKKAEIDAKQRQEAYAYQLRIWMELQDALEGIDNALATWLHEHEQHMTKAVTGRARKPTRQFRTVTFRARILCARLIDTDLIKLGSAACESAEQAKGLDKPAEIEAARNHFLMNVNRINDRINTLINESRHS